MADTILEEAWDLVTTKIEALPSDDGTMLNLEDIGEAWGMDGREFTRLVQSIHMAYLMSEAQGMAASLNSCLAMAFLAGLEYGRKHG